MAQRVYFVVEGPHDVELIGRLLKWWGLKRVQRVEHVDRFWTPLIPTAFPHKGDLLARVPVPTFFVTTGLEVAVSVAIGDSKIARTLNTDLSLPSFDARGLSAVGVVLDADTSPPHARWRALRGAIQPPPQIPIALPVGPNEVAPSECRFGVLVLPGDGSQGNLEDLLLACAEILYPRLLRKARTYLKGVDHRARLRPDELVEFRKGSGRKKALVATMAAPLKPGKAIQTSIQDNRWVSEATRKLPSVNACLEFMAAMLGRPL